MTLWHSKMCFNFQKPIIKFVRVESGNGMYKEVHFSKTTFLDYYSTRKSTHFLTFQAVVRLLYSENEHFTTYIPKITAEHDSDFIVLEEQYPTYEKMLDARYDIAQDIRVALLSSFENTRNGNGYSTSVYNTFGIRTKTATVEKTREVFHIGAASVCSDDGEI